MRIGIIGGGQLAAMLVEAGRKWNITFNVLDNTEGDGSICDGLVDTVIKGDLHDPVALKSLADISDIITYEIESIGLDALDSIHGKKIIPDPRVLKIIQDKYTQKIYLKDKRIPTTKFRLMSEIRDEDIIKMMARSQKIVIKKRRDGYNGMGVIIHDENGFNENKHLYEPRNDYIVEEFQAGMIMELSVIVARSDTECVCYDPIEMVFTDDNILDYQVAPARISTETEIIARQLALDSVREFGPGLYAIEMFCICTTKGNIEVLVNEISPRPHNSGHHTIESTQCSQFEQLLRILLGFRLGSCLTTPAIMKNILGPPEQKGEYVFNLKYLLSLPDTHVHDYRKKETYPNRKLGHITIVSSDIDDALWTLKFLDTDRIVGEK